ncbi:hypothetical protein D9758_004476 [Tetrapyrgos nigripes]|uniref:Cytochrome P450 n=1 Tax=Tetrapyrgos nigripes TaxID=182062 RepID=A0A8H5GNT1_9AGAR|nr:hypothetical protein D9758_004476 [Tetrapyrgos nigripes]
MGLLGYLDVFLAVVALYCVVRLFTSSSSNPPLPPGPRKLPLIGNLLDMPSTQEWITFGKWGELYGPISSASVFGQTIVVVNDAQVAVDMLDKHSAIYSDRPSIPMGGELVGWKNTLVLVPYGERFRSYRRLAHQLFGNAATMKAFHPVEEVETHRFLKRLLASPDAFSKHIRKTAGAIILRISHGYKVLEGEDPLVTLADQATEQFSHSTSPGGFLVNLVPALRHLPDWFPGAGFQKTAREWKATLDEMVDRPFNWVKKEMVRTIPYPLYFISASSSRTTLTIHSSYLLSLSSNILIHLQAAGSADMSYTSKLLEGKHLTANDEFDIKWSAASLYSGGADTTVSAIYSFFKAMALYPEVQAHAQAEVDAVIGSDRLPNFNDRDQLPYLNALTLEVLRWHSVVPISPPHRVTEDNVFNGYFIPKGSLVLANIWNMSHDPTIYHQPDIFKPERFIPSAENNYTAEPEPRDLSFGFGRRICPGRVLADASVFISCAMALAVFNISKYSENGKVFEPDTKQNDGTISHPSEFRCTLIPRSEKAVQLIQAEEAM